MRWTLVPKEPAAGDRLRVLAVSVLLVALFVGSASSLLAGLVLLTAAQDRKSVV